MGVADTFFREMGSEQDRQVDLAVKAEQVKQLRRQQAQTEADAKRKYAIENAALIREYTQTLDFQKYWDTNPNEIGKWQAALNANEMVIGTPLTTLTDQRDDMYAKWSFDQIQLAGKGKTPEQIVEEGYSLFGSTYLDRKFTKMGLEQAIKVGSVSAAFAPPQSSTPSDTVPAKLPTEALPPEPVMPNNLREAMASLGVNSVDQLTGITDADIIQARNKYVTEMDTWNKQKEMAVKKTDEQAKQATQTAPAKPAIAQDQQPMAPKQTAMNARDFMLHSFKANFRNPIVQEDIENFNKNMALAKSAAMPTEFIDTLRVEGIRLGLVDPKTTAEQWKQSFERDKFQYQITQDKVKTAISIGKQVADQMNEIVKGGGVLSELSVDDAIGKTLRSKIAPYQKTLWEINKLYQFVLTGDESTEQMPEDFGIGSPISALDQATFEYRYKALDYTKQQKAAEMAMKISQFNRNMDFKVANANRQQSNSNRSYGLAVARLGGKSGKYEKSTLEMSLPKLMALTELGIKREVIHNPAMQPMLVQFEQNMIKRDQSGVSIQEAMQDASDPNHQAAMSKFMKMRDNLNSINAAMMKQNPIKESDIKLSTTSKQMMYATIAFNGGFVPFEVIGDAVSMHNASPNVGPKGKRDATEYQKAAAWIALNGGGGLKLTETAINQAIKEGFIRGDSVRIAKKYIDENLRMKTPSSKPAPKPQGTKPSGNIPALPLIPGTAVGIGGLTGPVQGLGKSKPAPKQGAKPKATTTQKPVLSRLRSRTTNWTVTKEQKK